MDLREQIHRAEVDGLGDLPDRRLVDTVAAVVGVPRAEVREGLHSFVLHAPLELLARAALLPWIDPSARVAARRRIVALAVAYEAAGPPVDPPRPADHPSTHVAMATLRDAVAAGDPETADAAAAWLGTRASPREVARGLAGLTLNRLGAAGHANIFTTLIARTHPFGPPGLMLRHPAAALARDPEPVIPLPEGRSGSMTPEDALRVLVDTPVVGPPGVPFIAPMVGRAVSRGVTGPFERLAADAPDPVRLLRFAAQAMLQGPVEHAPYGWTHHLTLAQAALSAGDVGGGVPGAAFVAATYLAALWACLGGGRIDLHRVPEPVDVSFSDTLGADPSTAAAAAWHAPDPGPVITSLATRAATAHDAHRVKYTLACIEAAVADPAAARLHVAAAAHLNALWDLVGDPSDPLAG